MISRFIFSAFVALGLLIGIISGSPAPSTPRPGSTVTENDILRRTEYKLVYTVPKWTSLWEFDVYSTGYDGTKGKEKPANGVQEGERSKVLDNFTIDTKTKTLTVKSVWNAYDKTPNRLRLRQILHASWEKTGVDPLELKAVRGTMIQNKEMQDAVEFCRKDLGLGRYDDYRVKPDAKGKKCWDRFEKTVFSKIIKGAIRDFGPSKTLVQIELDRQFNGDNVLYTFN
ncbi:hypothetical protein BGZ61DRAFT_534641 [Ilyonectria robusta]|uniref:uncharacterized protein n=1 Tax=Ilyonectria robusta TaxID=1079257 RepID=UPI001E8EE72A|nr:uncharacterized protein BGZ61DRAFT_534641 [Ilyonectria robusta]KAH8683957.1 hypothetical protein BGZ61DRAFT_534641 [Ilyonectria robusta]